MAKKKLSEMTPIERVEQRMKGMSWEEAEDVGVEILARCLALHIYARKDGVEYFERLTKRIIERTDSWRKEASGILAMAAVAYERQMEETKK